MCLILLGLLAAQVHAAEVWEQPFTPVLSAGDGRAAACGGCHTEIYAEWKQSVHAHAWTDPQFQGELNKDPDVGWMCLNCHTPVANQQQMTVLESGVVRNPEQVVNSAFDAQWRAEGISCLGCHWREEGIAAVHADVDAPHPTVTDPSLRTVDVCTRCHQAVNTVEDGLVCHFNTGAEHEASGNQQTCQDCHMPAVSRPVVIGGPVRDGKRHSWGGSGIGKGPGHTPEALQSLTLETPDLGPVKPGTALVWTFSVSNTGAGHRVPTGDPERFLRITAVARDTAGAELKRSEWRIGQEWVWSPVAQKLGDNRLAPGERREFSLDFSQPKDGAVVELSIDHVRITKENLDYHIELVRSGHSGPSVEELRGYPRQRRVLKKTVRVVPGG